MDTEGNPEYITGINIDLTEQVLARKKIEESEKEIQSLFMQAPVSIILFEGEDLVARVVNDAALRIIGRPADQVVNKSLFSFFPDLPERTNIYSQVFQTGIPYEGKEVEISFTRNGKVFTGFFDLNYSPWRDANGKTRGVMSVGVEVTEKVAARKKIENISTELEAMVKERTMELENKNIQLEYVQSFLRQIVDTSVEFISVLDKDLKYIIVNKKFESELQLKRENVEGRHVLDVNPGLEGTFQYECIRKALDGQTTHLDKRRSIARPDIYEDAYIIPLIIQNKTEGVIIMARDVTDIVSSEILLEQKNVQLQNSLTELEQLFIQLQDQKLKDEQKDDFILMASHELKTPVTTIKGYVQLLTQVRAASAKSDTAMDKTLFDSALKTIDKQINKLTSLISELLDLSKIEKGQLELFETKFDLAELVRDVVQDVQYTTQHKIQLTIRSKNKVFGDKDRIMQVLINLITNAVKYSPGADKISIEVYAEKNDMAAVTVKDYGIGIDKADHAKIFERFYRFEGKREKTFPGFGIGLFIANDIIRRHGGEIRVRSEKNNGSEFTFLIPVAR
jgi:PAS domain S-box-containing protein